MNPLVYLAHLWAVPPIDLALPCPAPPSGQSTNPTGLFDNASVSAAFNTAAAASTGIVVLIILYCYLANRQASGPRFDKRWLVSLAVTIVACAAASYLALDLAHTTAAANTCESNPNAFAFALPTGVVVNRAVAGLVWGALAFTLGSVLFTALLGRIPSLKNGFYHNRGTPWPRMMPGGK